MIKLILLMTAAIVSIHSAANAQSSTPTTRDPVIRVVITDDKSWYHLCTAVAIDPDYALTAGHCMLSALVTVLLDTNRFWQTTNRIVVDLGIGNDLAIFYFNHSGYMRAVLRDGPTLPGDKVLLDGYPYGVRRAVSCTVIAYSGRNGGLAECSSSLSPGASGSPLFYKGQVAGIATHLLPGSTNIVAFTTAHRIRDFLQAWRAITNQSWAYARR